MGGVGGPKLRREGTIAAGAIDHSDRDAEGQNQGEVRLLREEYRIASLRAWYALARSISSHPPSPPPHHSHAAEPSTEPALTPRTLRAFSFAARRIAPLEFECLCEFRDSKGQALTPWHIVALARLSRRERAELLEEMRTGKRSLVKARERVGRKKDRSDPK
jgi:hypothetical protein